MSIGYVCVYICMYIYSYVIDFQQSNSKRLGVSLLFVFLISLPLSLSLSLSLAHPDFLKIANGCLQCSLDAIQPIPIFQQFFYHKKRLRPEGQRHTN